MLRFSRISFYHSPSSRATTTTTTRVVLRNLPGIWGRRAKKDIDNFVRRVVASRSFLGSPSSHSNASSFSNRFSQRNVQQQYEDEEGDGDFSSTSKYSTTKQQQKTIPAGMIPPHIREKWNLPTGSGEEEEEAQQHQEQHQEHQRATEFHGLDKYFGGKKGRRNFADSNSSRSISKEQHQQKYVDENDFENNNNDRNNDDDEYFSQNQQQDNNYNKALPDAGVLDVKFNGETRRTMICVIKFRSNKDATRFSNSVNSYLEEVRRTQGLGIPANVVGYAPDEFSLLDKRKLLSKDVDESAASGEEGGVDEQQDNDNDTLTAEAERESFINEDGVVMVTAATLDRYTADSGLQVNSFVENNAGFENINDEKLKRKEMALSAFRSAGKKMSSNNKQQNFSSSVSPFDSDDVRSSMSDLVRQKERTQLAAARAEELDEIYESNPFVVDALHSQNNNNNSTDVIPTNNNNKNDTLSKFQSNKSKVSPHIQLTSLFFQHNNGKSIMTNKNRNNNNEDEIDEDEIPKERWEYLAEEEELNTCDQLDLDRYLMSYDVLWDTRKKYMPRRKWTSQSVYVDGFGREIPSSNENRRGDELLTTSDTGGDFGRRNPSQKRKKLSSWWSTKDVYE